MSNSIASRSKAPQNLLVALQAAQTRLGHIPPELMRELAESLDIPVNDVYGVASFYSFISTRPLGRHVIRICRSLPCHYQGGQAVIDAVAGAIGVSPGETTPDGRFSFELVNCIGLCDKAPAMLVNDDPHVGLTPSQIPGILEGYR